MIKAFQSAQCNKNTEIVMCVRTGIIYTVYFSHTAHTHTHVQRFSAAEVTRHLYAKEFSLTFNRSRTAGSRRDENQEAAFESEAR